jgi:hypothetical protein
MVYILICTVEHVQTIYSHDNTVNTDAAYGLVVSTFWHHFAVTGEHRPSREVAAESGRNLPIVGNPTEWRGAAAAAAAPQVARLSPRGPRAIIAAIEKSVARVFTVGRTIMAAAGPSSCIVPSNIPKHTPQHPVALVLLTTRTRHHQILATAMRSYTD